MNCLFLYAQWKKDNSIIDIFWGFGFILLSCFSLFLNQDITLKKALLNMLVLLWGLRLAIHIYIRNKGSGEDFRYQNWRQTWKNFYVRSYLQVFMLQAAIMLIVASPIILVNSSGSETTGFLEIAGSIIFLAGFLFESISDYQLAAFRQQPENKGQIITTGLWKYSRHPNYFGEAILWWGIWLIAVPEFNGLFTILSPIVITILLRYVSGVPMLEKKYEGHPDWEDYKKTVPPFIPRFQR